MLVTLLYLKEASSSGLMTYSHGFLLSSTFLFNGLTLHLSSKRWSTSGFVLGLVFLFNIFSPSPRSLNIIYMMLNLKFISPS